MRFWVVVARWFIGFGFGEHEKSFSQMCLESLEALGNSSSTSAAADNSFMDFTVQTNGKLCLIRKQSRFFFYQILTLLIFHCLMLLNTLLYSEPRPFENCTMIIILRVATQFPAAWCLRGLLLGNSSSELVHSTWFYVGQTIENGEIRWDWAEYLNQSHSIFKLFLHC